MPTAFSSHVPVPPLDQRGEFAVGDGAFKHPEAAVGVGPSHAAGAQNLLGSFDAASDFVAVQGALREHREYGEFGAAAFYVRPDHVYQYIGSLYIEMLAFFAVCSIGISG